MPKERVIVVGAGNISNAWFPPLKSEDLNIVAVVDLKLDAAKEKIQKYELPNTLASDDLDRVLRDQTADFLLDLTVPEAHCQVTCKALSAGLHVISEKPMAASMDEARRMVQTSERTGKMYMVSQSRRWESLQQSVAATIATGALGNLTEITCDFYLAAHFGGFRDVMDSPLLGDMSIHHFDMARLFTGANAVSCYAEEFNPKGSWYKGSPATHCLFEMTDGIRFSYRGSWCSEGCHTSWAGHWRIVGDKGTLLYENDRLTGEIVAGTEGFIRPKSPLPIVSLTPQHTTMHGALREMLNFLRTGQTPQTECHDNIHSLAMIHAAIQSAQSGSRVALTPSPGTPGEGRGEGLRLKQKTSRSNKQPLTQRKPMKRSLTSRRAFTFKDLIVLLAVIVFALGLLIPAAHALQDDRVKQRCDSNLRQIGHALILYANENNNAFPRVRWNPKDPKPVSFTKVDAKDPFASKDGPVNDVSAAMFLLIRTQEISSEVFICPATKDEKETFGGGDHTAQDISNFHSRKNLSYSYADPYPSSDAVGKGYRLNSATRPDFAIMADINPGSPDLLKVTASSPQDQLNQANSPNHSHIGQCILYADGHTDWQTTPFAGVDQDNIYTFGPSGKDKSGHGIVGSPSGPDDSILLPTDVDVK